MPQAAERHKGDASGIASVDELDQYIRLIGKIDLGIEANETDMNVQLTEIKRSHQAQHAELAAQRSILLAQVQAYVTMHREEVLGAKAKTRKLNFGQVGWRKLPDRIEGLPGKGSDEMERLCAAVDRLKETRPEPFGEITIHTDRYLMRSDVKKLGDGDLSQIGLNRQAGADEFFVQADKEKLREVENVG